MEATTAANREVLKLNVRQKANVNLYHVTTFPLYQSFTVHYFYA